MQRQHQIASGPTDINAGPTGDDDARDHAERIRPQATAEADAIRAQARDHAARILSQPRHALRQALDKLD